MPDSNHILVLPPQASGGKTYIIGDVHGEIEAFDEVLERLNPQDILIIAGDLIDRGGILDAEKGLIEPTSKRVMDTLLRYAAATAGTLPKIYVIQGNHEQDFLDILALFEKLKVPENRNSTFYAEAARIIMTFIHNGGAWIFDRDDNSPEQNERFLAFKNYGYQPNHSLEDQRQLITHIKSLFRSEDPVLELLPEIQAYREFITVLPFVIKVEGERPVLVVHADLAFSDEEIDRKIAEKEAFTPEEILHMTGARVREYMPAGMRDHVSNLVVVGHNILDEPDSSSSTPALPVRSDTNHINLDGGAYFTKGFLCFNVTDNQIDIVGTKAPTEIDPLLLYGQAEIAEHLRTLAHGEDREDQSEEHIAKRARR
jgi:predicted phosphodiesterase